MPRENSKDPKQHTHPIAEIERKTLNLTHCEKIIHTN